MTFVEHDTFPFDHWIIDGFLSEKEALSLSEEFPAYDEPMWVNYCNPLENKKLCNHWERFPANTYRFFSERLSSEYSNILGELCGIDGLKGDIGLHGGGWHIHQTGGKLNVHLDYSIHPKTGMQRRLNLILYLTPDWQQEWGGGLELWSHDEEKNKPKQCEKYVECKFNRAVIFRTDQKSWHGLPSPIACPKGVYRKSLAAYYVSSPDADADPRGRALFSASKEQESDPSIEAFIKLRQS